MKTNTKVATRLHVKKGDKVKVISGKNKGKEGVVSRSIPQEGKIVIDGVNMVKKTMKAKTANQKGSIVEVAVPLYASKVKKI